MQKNARQNFFILGFPIVGVLFFWIALRLVWSNVVFYRAETYHISITTLIKILFTGSVGDIFFLFSYFLLMFFFCYRIRRTAMIAIANIVILFLLSLFLIVDYIIFLYIYSHLNLSLFSFIGSDLISLIKYSGVPVVLFIIIIGIFLALLIFFQIKISQLTYQKMSFRYVIGFAVFIIFSSGILYFHSQKSYSPVEDLTAKNVHIEFLQKNIFVNFIRNDSEESYSSEVHIPSVWHRCLLGQESDEECKKDSDGDSYNRYSDCNDEASEISPDTSDIPGNFIDENCDGVDQSPPNIILVFLESFRDDLGIVEGKEITPNFENLKRQHSYFPRFYATGVQSNMARMAVLCSVQPNFGVNIFMQYSKNNFYCLPEILSNVGYVSALFNGGSLSFTNQREMYLNMGFNQLHDPDVEDKDSRFTHWGVSDEDLFASAFNWVDKYNSQNPYFLMLYTVSNHYPWELPDKSQKVFKSEKFFNTLHYSDSSFAAFYKNLKDNNYLENTVMIVLADTGQPISEHDQGKFPVGYLFEENIRVPLLIIDHGNEHIYDTSTVSGQLDVLPTILDRLGINIPNNFQGKSLLKGSEKNKNDFQVISLTPFNGGKFAFIEDKRKIVVDLSKDEVLIYNIVEGKEVLIQSTKKDREVYLKMSKEKILKNFWMLDKDKYWDDSYEILSRIKRDNL